MKQQQLMNVLFCLQTGHCSKSKPICLLAPVKSFCSEVCFYPGFLPELPIVHELNETLEEK